MKRFFWFGTWCTIVAGFAMQLSCGTTPTCSPATCPSGCCNAAEQCEAGNDQFSCGAAGQKCTACVGSQLCLNHFCSPFPSGGSTGGGGSGFGGGTFGSGGGSQGTGGGYFGTGGGSQGTGGGSFGTGGGTQGTGGGSFGTGGGTQGTGGGSFGTGGGTQGTGGGTFGTGGGGGTSQITGCHPEQQNCSLLGAPGKPCMYTNIDQRLTACLPGCDLVLQNCTIPNESCTYRSGINEEPMRLCGPAGTKTERESCSSATGCQKGLICGQSQSTCVKTCYDDNDCTFPNSYCIGLMEVPGEYATVCHYFTPCNPLAPSACTPDEGCYAFGSRITSPICSPAGSGLQGSSCSTVLDCSPGTTCVGSSNGTCESYCNLDGGTPSCTGNTCKPAGALPFGFCQ